LLAGIVVGAGVLVSNTLHRSNGVSLPVTLTLKDADSGLGGNPDAVNWSEGPASIGIPYDFKVNYSANDEINISVVFWVSSTAITPASLTLEYWNGSSWLPLSFGNEDNDTIKAEIPLELGTGDTKEIIMILTYIEAGDYAWEVFAESR